MKKIILLTALVTVQTSFAFAFPFFASNEKKAETTQQQPITENQIARLNKTVKMIQEYYIQKVDEKVLMDNAITGMLAKLDPHSAYLTKNDIRDLETTVSGEFVGIGVELTADRGLLKVISPIEGSPAEKAGLKPGDLIIKINNKLVQDMSINDAITQIKGKANTKVSLMVLRKDEKAPVIIHVMREVVHVKAIQAKMLAPGYAYVRITLFQGPVADQMSKAIKKLKAESQGHLKGLVLDLRNNPGGLLDVSAEVLDLFLNKKETTRYQNLVVYTKGRMPNSDLKYYAHDKDMIPHVPMITLINGGSASASEIVAGALQDYKRAIIMGTRSFGKGSVQTILPVGDDSAVKLTTALYYTPAGREIQARGIEPDVIIPELALDEKKAENTLGFDEATYNNHIQNHAGNDAGIEKLHIASQREQQQSNVKLAKDDYQLYEALMLLKGMHAMR
ncbi:MAG: S41 family peptidase [Coxiellaceae bacterium]|nr:S41 family peptidase [Coxiellaceae bacterium]